MYLSVERHSIIPPTSNEVDPLKAFEIDTQTLHVRGLRDVKATILDNNWYTLMAGLGRDSIWMTMSRDFPGAGIPFRPAINIDESTGRSVHAD